MLAAADPESTSPQPSASSSSPKNEIQQEKNQNESNYETRKLPEFAWMVKPCHFYKDEYSDCKSIKARFHQYFVHGETLECGQWKEDYLNCYEWNDKDDVKYLEKLIDSEKVRAKNRLKAHYDNDVWEARLQPPPDWNSELPDKIKSGYENSFLKLKADEMKSGKVNLDDDKRGPFNFNLADTTCSIV